MRYGCDRVGGVVAFGNLGNSLISLTLLFRVELAPRETSVEAIAKP